MQLLLLFGYLSVGTAVAAQGWEWRDKSLPIPQRVQSLIAEMTLEEKIAQLNYFFPPFLDFSTLAAPWNTTSFGAMTIESTLNHNASTCNMSCRITNLRQFQEKMIANTRLGIPVSFVIETSHSGAAGGTIFPMGSSQGASWNQSLVHEIAEAIALEARSWGGDRGLSPEINVCPDPRFGRLEENFGEDPLHVSYMAVAAVTGLQGGNARPSEYLDNNHIAAEAKHCCGYGAGGYDGAPAEISEKTFHDVYLRPWRRFIAAGGRGMMLAHNELNGVQMHMNGPVMSDLFRTQYGYEGFFHSDYANIDALVSAHVAANVSQAAALALHAGMDQTFLGQAYQPATLLPMVASGAIQLADINRAASAMLTQKFAAGLFDGALPDPSRRPAIRSDTHVALARQAAQEGTVLLENNGILPLDVAGLKRVAVIGPNSGCAPGAESPWTCLAMRAMLGGYSNQEQATDALLDNTAPVITVLEAVREAASKTNGGFSVSYAAGCDVESQDTSGFPAAVAAATGADIALVVLGDSAEAVGYDSSASCGEGADRPTLDLPGVQLALLQAIIETKTPTVVVLVHGRPATFGSEWGGSRVSLFGNGPPLNKQVAALLAAWRPGCEGGHAIWDILSGAVSPSGRLAQAWPRTVGAVHAGGVSPWFQKFCSEECGGYTVGTSYSPAYAFGYGLDYLTVIFGQSTATVDAAQQTVTLTVVLSNASPTHGGATVVQVYFTQAVSTYTRYRSMLAGFTKVAIAPGGVGVVAKVVVPWQDLAYYDLLSSKRDFVEAGQYEFRICFSSLNCPSANKHTVTIPTTVYF